MKITISILLILIFAGTFNYLFAQNIESINPLEAKKLKDSKSATFIDVREENELIDGTIEGSMHVPMSLLTSNRSSFNKIISKISIDKPIIVFCRSGRRSSIVGSILKRRGFKVLNLGGFENWKNATQN